MFKKSDPQRNLFGVEAALPESLKSRLKDSWAEIFRTEVLTILMRAEEDFAGLYGNTGREVGRTKALFNPLFITSPD